MNSIWLTRLAVTARTPARRAGASTLALVCAGLALEALLYVALAQSPSNDGALVATLLVRTTLALSMLFVGALVLRSASARR